MKKTEESTALLPSVGESLQLTELQSSLKSPDTKGRPEKVRNGIQTLVEAGSKLNIMTAELLHEVRQFEYWKEYSYFCMESEDDEFYGSFNEYVAAEFPFQPRTAYYWMEIYQKFVLELEIPRDELIGLEWSKAKEISKIVTKENYESWLSLLPTISVKDLKKEIRDALSAKTPELASSSEPLAGTVSTPSEEDEFISRTFNLAAPQDHSVMEALSVAEYETKSTSSSHLLDMICNEFLASRAIIEDKSWSKEDQRLYSYCARLDRIIQGLERVFSAKIKVEKMG